MVWRCIVTARACGSGSARSVRHSVARVVGVTRSWSTARRKERAIRQKARAVAAQVLSDHVDVLARGSWRLMLYRKGTRGRPLATMQRPVQPILVHDSIDDSEALSLLKFRRAGTRRYREVWTDDWTPSLPQPLGTVTGELRATVVLPRHSGKVLLFDLDRENVLRVSETASSPEHERLRRVFSRSVPSVPFRSLPGGRRIMEPLVRGDALHDAPSDVRLRSIAELLDHLAEVAQSSEEGEGLETVASAVNSARSDPAVDQHGQDLIEWLGAGKLVPSHGDLCGVNVLVTEAGPVCIDFGEMSVRPAWFDGLTLVFSAMRERKEDMAALDRMLHGFLLRVVPVPPPDGWRRLASLGSRLLGGPTPSAVWVDLRG